MLLVLIDSTRQAASPRDGARGTGLPFARTGIATLKTA